MNIVKIKGWVNSNRVSNYIAEKVLNIYVILRYALTRSYTKYKEDREVMSILTESGGVKADSVKYLDIGANDFRRGNNTYLFYKKGARGLLIEANPILTEKLGKHRPGDTVLNYAVGTDDCSEVDFYVLSLQTRSSMDKKEIDESLSQGLKLKEIIKVPSLSIQSLLDQYSFWPDYMSIDIEGMDYKVLRSMDFDKCKIKVIVAEWSDKVIEMETMDEFMQRMGYLVHWHKGSNVIYARRQMQNIAEKNH